MSQLVLKPSTLANYLTMRKRNKSALNWTLLSIILLTLYKWSLLSTFTSLLVLFLHYVITGGYRFLYVFYKTAYRDAM